MKYSADLQLDNSFTSKMQKTQDLTKKITPKFENYKFYSAEISKNTLIFQIRFMITFLKHVKGQ